MRLPPVSELMDDVRVAIVFFTRLPASHASQSGRPFAQSLWAAPIAGLAVAGCGALTLTVAGFLGIPALPAAALALGAVLLATGCLHEDGLADAADGLGGGKTRERKLEIMRDSRIGTFGAAALGLSLILRWSALASLATVEAGLAALVAAHCASRAAIPAFMAWTPPARADGLAATVGGVSTSVAGVAALLGFAAMLGLGFDVALIVAFALAVWVALFRKLVMRQIGGQTGDTIGALQQGAEIIALLAASAALTIV